MARRLRWILALLVVAGFLWLAFKPQAPVEVRVVTVERGAVEHLVPSVAAGALEPHRDARVVAERGGTVAEVLHEAGVSLEAGALVARLDDRDASEALELERLDLESLEARLSEARIRRDQAAREYRRVWELWQEGVFTQQRAEQARAESELAEASVRSLAASVDRGRAAVAVSERRLAETRLATPIAGVLKTVHVEQGDVLAPKQPVFEVMDASSLEVRVVTDEVDAALLEVGQEARLHVEAYPGRVFPGRVVWIAPAVELTERASRGIEIRVELDEPDPELRVGMTADVDVLVGRSEDALNVSSRAVTLDDAGPAVYRLEGKPPVVRLERVETGIATFDRTELLSGVSEGDVLVLETDQVSDGVRVRISKRIDDEDEDG